MRFSAFITRRHKASFLYIFAMVFCFFYYFSYRYIFKIGDSGTSPTYSDTPWFLKVGKYLIMAGAVCLFCLRRVRKCSLNTGINFGLYLYLSCVPLLAAAELRNAEMFKIGFGFLCAGGLHFIPRMQFDSKDVGKLFSFTLVVCLMANILQIINFVLVGRLPSLAYENSYTVRFGSILDDPNGFGLLLCFFWGFALHFYSGWRRRTALFLIMFSLILTQSLTAMGAWLGAFSVSFFIQALKDPLIRVKNIVAAVFSLAVLALSFLFFYDEVSGIGLRFLESKMGSIQGHLSSVWVLNAIDVYVLLGLTPSGITSEIGYFDLLVNFGVGYVLCFLLVFVGAIRYFFVLERFLSNEDVSARSLIVGFRWYLIAFLFGIMNLPYERIFSTWVFAALGLSLASARCFDQVSAPKCKSIP